MTCKAAIRHARSDIPDEHRAVAARRRKLGVVVAPAKLVSRWQAT